MKRFSSTNILAVAVLLFLGIGCISMIWGEFFPSEASSSAASVDIDWRALYPFPENAPSGESAAPQAVPHADYLSLVAKIKNRLDDSKDHLLGKQALLELCGAFRRLTGQTETNGIVLLNNGYLTTIVSRTGAQQAEAIADSVINLARSADARGIPLLYIQIPQKVCRYDDQMPLGQVTYINENLDDHLALLQSGGVETLDLRDALHEAGLEHYSLYFRTDHHWTMPSGLWAARTVAEELNERYGYALDCGLLDEENFDAVTYPDWYLGTQGRTVTRGYIAPDDFTLLLPKFDTFLRVEHPDKAVDVTGDFYATMFNQEMLTTKDYYGQSTYESVLYGNRPLSKLTNLEQPDGLRILLIHDSYSTVVAPYLSLLSGEIDMIDVRAANGNFDGNLLAYLDEMQPDIVIAAFCSPVNLDRSAG